METPNDIGQNIFFSSEVLSLQLNNKHLIVLSNQQAGLDCEIKILVLKTPHSHLVHTQDWLITVMLWCSERETNDLWK